MFERRLYFHIDWLLLAAVLSCCARPVDDLQHDYVTLPDGAGHPGPRFWVQLYAVGLGVLALAIFLALDYRFLAEHSLFLYIGVCAAALVRAGRRRQAGGSQRWISLGPSTCSLPSLAVSRWR
jgi:cell division protein FtsW (lipid II flippase)